MDPSTVIQWAVAAMMVACAVFAAGFVSAMGILFIRDCWTGRV